MLDNHEVLQDLVGVLSGPVDEALAVLEDLDWEAMKPAGKLRMQAVLDRLYGLQSELLEIESVVGVNKPPWQKVIEVCYQERVSAGEALERIRQKWCTTCGERWW